MEGDDPHVALQQAFCDRLRDRIGPHRYATWFEGAIAVAVATTPDASYELRLTASSTFEQGLVRKQFLGDIESAAGETLGAEARVTFSLGGSASTDNPAGVAVRGGEKRLNGRETRAASGGAASLSAPQRRVVADPLAGWVVGEGNRPATTLCRRLIEGQTAPSPALLWGPAGVGKTRLLNAVADGVRARDKRRRVLLVGAERFLNDFVEAVRGGGLPSFRLKYRAADLLIVDDVQLLLGKTRTAEEFKQTLDALGGGTRVLLSADRGPVGLSGLGPELASRLAGGLSVEVPLPDVATRRRLVEAAAEQIGLELPEAVAETLAARLVGGAREVSGAINRMALLHETFASPIDEALATQVADDANRLSTPPVRLADIQRAVCGVFEVDSKALRSDKRTKAVTEPRMLAMWLARRMTGSPWSEIGDFFGRRSHSTVISAHRRVEKLLAAPKPTQLRTGELGETIRRIEAALRTG